MNKELEEKCLLTPKEYRRKFPDWRAGAPSAKKVCKAQLKKATPILIAEGRQQMLKEIEKYRLAYTAHDYEGLQVIPAPDRMGSRIVIGDGDLLDLKKEVEDEADKH